MPQLMGRATPNTDFEVNSLDADYKASNIKHPLIYNLRFLFYRPVLWDIVGEVRSNFLVPYPGNV